MILRQRFLRGAAAALVLLVCVPATALDLDRASSQITNRVSPSVVSLDMTAADGEPLPVSCGFVADDGVVATSLHNVAGAVEGHARPVGQERRCSVLGVLAVDLASDLALLSVESLYVKPLTVTARPDLVAGDAVCALSEPTTTEGVVYTGAFVAYRQLADVTLLQMTLPLFGGSDGGPVVDAAGEVVGVATAAFDSSERLYFATDAKHLATLMNSPREVKPLASIAPGEPAWRSRDAFVAGVTTFLSAEAAAGDAVAMANLGDLHAVTTGEYALAVKWYRRAAEAGNAAAMQCLGILHAEGLGVKRSDRRAVELYRQAADLGNARAMTRLGLMYARGVGVARDCRQAARWYRKAIELKNTMAMCNLAQMYIDGRGVDRDYGEAMALYRQAAEVGFARANAHIAMMYASGQGVRTDPRKMMQWLLKGAEAGDVTAMELVAHAYECGKDLRKDTRLALQWYRRAARAGHVGAIARLGMIFAEGLGVVRDGEEAFRWFRRGAALGDPYSIYNVGLSYARGRGVARNDAEAVRWYQRAAEMGWVEAMSNLGGMILTGRGGDRKPSEAIDWFRKAAALGHPSAMYNLGISYENGNGVEKDYIKAYVWYTLADSFGFAHAKAPRDTLHAALTSEALAEAKWRIEALRKLIKKPCR